MNIYFINRNSKWKGPFDVIDARNKRIINIGDVCLRDTNEGISFLLVENNTNKWNSCRTIGYGINEKFSQIGNSLLFSFDGVSNRHGNIDLLRTLVGCYTENRIIIFFSNAIEILEYEKDFWDFGVLQQLLTPPQDVFNQQEGEMMEIKSNSSPKHFPSKFISYFDDSTIDKIISLLNSGKTLHESYAFIRNAQPAAFQTAFVKFLKENPEKTIYDRYTP